MSPDPNEPNEFFQYRGYLRFLARRLLSTHYNGKLDHSDIVQQTLLNTFAKRAQFQGKTEAERLAWLRKTLVRTITHATRDLHAKKRDIQRERAIQADLDASSSRLESFLVGKEASPSQHFAQQDRVRIVAAAIELLPAKQRQVVILRYWEEKSLREISVLLGKSIPAVAGLLSRASKKLRSLLDAENTEGFKRAAE